MFIAVNVLRKDGIMRGKNTITGANKVFFTFTVIFLFFQFLLTIIVGFLSVVIGVEFANEFLNRNIYPILLINQFVIILIPVLVYTFVNKLDVKEVFRLNKLDFAPAVIITLIAVPAYFVAVMLNTIVVYILQFIGNVPAQPLPVPQNLPELIKGILIVGVTPSICEEMLHRGIMLSAYERRGSKKAVVITAIFFGIFHFDITNLLGATFLGLLIGYYVIKTNSIFAGALAHFLNNTINELLQYLLRDNVKPSDEIIRVPVEELFGAVLYGIMGLIIIGLLLAIFNRITRGKYIMKPPISTVRKDFVSIVSHWPIIVIIVVYVLLTVMFISSIAV